MGLNSNLVSLINNLSDFNLSNHQAKFIEHYNIIFSDSFEIFIYRFIDIPSKKYPDKNVRAHHL